MSAPTDLVSAVVVIGDRVVLTAHEPSWRYHFPDGDIRADESPYQALIRSFREDLGAVVVPDLLPCWTSEFNGPGGRYRIAHFRSRLIDPGASFSCRDGLVVALASAEDARALRVARATLDVLEHVLGWKR